MIGLVSVECQAQSPNLPLFPWTAYVNSPSSIRVRNVPKKIGSWCITRVYVSVVYPDGQIKTADCVPVGGVYVGTVAGAGVSGTTENGYVIMADGTDENGASVTGYVLGRGNVTILDDDGILQPDAKRYYVRMLSADTENHYEGDLYPTESGYVIWQNGQANLLGTPFEQISAYVESAVSAKADLSAIHGDYIEDATGNKICADRTVEIVENDGKQITQDELALKSDLPTKTSQLSNDSGFITSSDIPTIPTNTSQLSNDSGYITSAEIEPYYNSLSSTTGLAKTAHNLALGDYASFLEPIEGGKFQASLRTNRDLTKQFRAAMSLATYHPYVMSMYNGQTLSPELSLYFCKDELRYGTTRPRQYYEGYMFRTAGAGFAIPCSEDGTPDGRLVETTGVQPSWVLMANNTTSIHSIGFSTRYSDQYGIIDQIDGQTDSIFAQRLNQYNSYSIQEEIANKSELPAKTSDLTNDSGFITAADIITKRDLNDLNIYADPMAEHTPIEVTVWHNDEISTLYVLNWDGSSWYYTDGSTNIQIYFDGYSSAYIITGFIQDMGGTQRNINGQFDLTSPLWSVTFETQYFYKIEIASIKAHIATKEYVDSRLSALEARIAALEGN